MASLPPPILLVGSVYAPNAVLELASQSHPTSPQVFTFRGIKRDLLAYPLHVELIDADLISESTLGAAHVESTLIAEMIEEAARSPPGSAPPRRELQLQLSTQGSVTLAMEVLLLLDVLLRLPSLLCFPLPLPRA